MNRYLINYTGYALNIVGPDPVPIHWAADIVRDRPIASAKDIAEIAAQIRIREKLGRVIVTGWKKYEE